MNYRKKFFFIISDSINEVKCEDKKKYHNNNKMESMFNFNTFPWSCFYLTNAFVPVVGEQVMSMVDALVTFLFGVCLPSWDVYSDVGLAYRFLTNRCHTFKSYLYYEKYHQWKFGGYSNILFYRDQYRFQNTELLFKKYQISQQIKSFWRILF